MRMLRAAFSLTLGFLLFGCASTSPAPKKLVTDIPWQDGRPEYWFAQPATAGVESLDFDKLWNACQATARDYQLPIDWMDWRSGILSTQPVNSPEFFELWRRDLGGPSDYFQDALQSIRRTVHFEVTRTADGAYIASPKVVLERLELQAHRLSSVTQYQGAFLPENPDEQVMIDRGQAVPSRYWYAFGRDNDLERKLAESVKDKLK